MWLITMMLFIHSDEWLLYRQLASLNGRIYLSNVTKYRAPEDDLIDVNTARSIGIISQSFASRFRSYCK